MIQLDPGGQVPQAFDLVLASGAKEEQDDVAELNEVGEDRALTHPGVVLAQGGVFGIMGSVLDPPMLPDDPGPLGPGEVIGRMTADSVAIFPCLAPVLAGAQVQEGLGPREAARQRAGWDYLEMAFEQSSMPGVRWEEKKGALWVARWTCSSRVG